MNLKSLLPLIPATALVCLSLATASGAPIIINNWSFEEPVLVNTYTVGVPGDTIAIPGWSISQANPLFDGDPYNYTAGITPLPSAPNGNQVAYAGNTNRAGSIGTLGQITSASFVAGTTYQLSTFAGTYASNLGTFQVSLLSDGIAVATTILDASTFAVETFQEINLTYVAPTSGGVIGIALTFLSGADSFQLGLFDNVTLNAVPEPSTAILFGLAGMALLFRKRASRRELIG